MKPIELQEQEEVVCSILEHTTEHGTVPLSQTQKLKYYNLDAVISVGCRVNSSQTTQFSICATPMASLIPAANV